MPPQLRRRLIGKRSPPRRQRFAPETVGTKRLSYPPGLNISQEESWKAARAHRIPSGQHLERWCPSMPLSNPESDELLVGRARHCQLAITIDSLDMSAIWTVLMSQLARRIPGVSTSSIVSGDHLKGSGLSEAAISKFGCPQPRD